MRVTADNKFTLKKDLAGQNDSATEDTVVETALTCRRRTRGPPRVLLAFRNRKPNLQYTGVATPKW